jgi:hypothetical protein
MSEKYLKENRWFRIFRYIYIAMSIYALLHCISPWNEQDYPQHSPAEKWGGIVIGTIFIGNILYWIFIGIKKILFGKELKARHDKEAEMNQELVWTKEMIDYMRMSVYCSPLRNTV